MNAINFFYYKFVEFCEQEHIKNEYSKNITKRHGLSASKNFILGYLNEDIFNRTLCWSNTPQGHEFWKDIHNKWKNYFNTKLVPKFQKVYASLDLTVFKYTENPFSYGTTDFNSIDFDEGYVLTYLNYSLYKIITRSKAPIKYVKIDVKKDLIHFSSKFFTVFKDFAAAFTLITDIYSSFKIDYIDIENDGKISYLPIDKTLKEDFDPKTAYINKNRKVTTIGRVLRKFDNWEDYVDLRTIEKLSNYFSTMFSDINVEIWKPSQVKEAYLETNYADKCGSKTSTLHNSCMRHKECQSYFDFYKAADTRIAVALDKNRKIIARALLWKINNSLYFLDRIYTINQSICINFALKVSKKVPIKYYKIDGTFYSIDNHAPVEQIMYSITRKKLINYSGQFPYLDSFWLFNKHTGTLTIPYSLQVLHSTSGGASGF